MKPVVFTEQFAINTFIACTCVINIMAHSFLLLLAEVYHELSFFKLPLAMVYVYAPNTFR